MSPGRPPSLDQVLARRAHASRATVVDVDEPRTKLVVAWLAREWLAFPGRQVREILPGTPAFFLPGCPPGLEGVINVRGDIEPVLCLRTLLHLPPPAPDEPSRILIGKGGSVQAGLRVDRVEEVMDVPDSALQPPPPTLPDPLRNWALSIFPFRNQGVLVLDIERLLGDYCSAHL
ncbi:chemotaxis protein CheW [Pararhodospirillum oryzae]|uniref:Chemotaxis protein CheW n=1 Tax=Pararhodospirillum oryzae TaxID=478448 RepID=A0A512H9G3_9PROT|nr:chemotaxis protein CheW [Pararhodospirillum oryzae]GEO82097.1 chemotaxis protein CheW [Pararhodospirillum oryzae]